MDEPIALDEQNGYLRKDGIVGTLTTDGNSPKHNNRIVESMVDVRVRKLTPKECWRLQGFSDEHYQRAKSAGLSKTQLYKQAGNSVTVNVVYEIAKRLEVKR